MDKSTRVSLHLPTEFIQTMRSLLEADWPDFDAALHEDPVRGVRLQRISSQPDLSMSDAGLPTGWAISRQPKSAPPELTDELLDTVPWAPNSYYIRNDSKIGKTAWHEAGAFYIQEPSAMAVVTALAPKPGERILDLCAAPGGKATAIGASLHGIGTLVANEIHPGRAQILAQNLERLGVPAIVTQERPDQLARHWPQAFDAVLVDAPCSGEGMFRKDPSAAEAWTPAAPERCANRQQEILEHAVRMVRPGGRLVYSTCTFNPTENEQIIAWLIKHFPVRIVPLPKWPGWTAGRPDWADGAPDLEGTRRLWPHRAHGEGHFVARLEVLEPVHSQTSRPSNAGSLRKAKSTSSAAWSSWLQDMCKSQVPDMWTYAVEHANHWFALTDIGLPLHSIKVIRPGICLAARMGNRIVPHHQWAMAVDGSMVVSTLGVVELDAIRYMKGESLQVGGMALQGWTWLHMEGLPIGWGKGAESRINNHYPKGLRRPELVMFT